MTGRFVAVVVLALLGVWPAHVSARQEGASVFSGVALYRSIARSEARRLGVPHQLVDAVMWVESRYNPAATGGVGEIGLMQLLPTTASLLGFRGTLRELRQPHVNIRLGARYLAKAWVLGKQDICTAVMKYRAGHGETRFSVRSVDYCRKVRRHLAKRGYKVSGVVPKPTFGFASASGKVLRTGGKRCFMRVRQPGPRFGHCISRAALRKRGLLQR
jgi:soluble lytic murein transglycosylase-like protein